MTDDRSHGERVKARILDAGLALWRQTPISGINCSAREIGRALGMTHSAVLYHFKTADALKAAVAAHAVSVGDDVVVPSLIAGKHPAAASLSAEDRRRYLEGC